MMYWEHLVKPSELSREQCRYVCDHADFTAIERNMFNAMRNEDDEKISEIIAMNELDDEGTVELKRSVGNKIVSALKL